MRKPNFTTKGTENTEEDQTRKIDGRPVGTGAPIVDADVWASPGCARRPMPRFQFAFLRDLRVLRGSGGSPPGSDLLLTLSRDIA
jgi:hypothetical protein